MPITDFLDPLNIAMLADDEAYKEGQLGRLITVYEDKFPDMAQVDIVLVGCNEERGNDGRKKKGHAPDAIRQQFYQLFFWHPDVKIADIGNVKQGATLADTYAALKMVVREMTDLGKMIIVLGGSHDLTLAQYSAYRDRKQIIEAVCIDAKINLSIEMPQPSEKFLMEMLTGEPNYIRHYNHIGFQSYFVHPGILETMDKLRFDCFRVGKVKDSIEEMEPVIRNCHLLSFDMSSVANAFAPANALTPNGFDGEQACTLLRYAGLSPNINTIGIYGFDPEKDREHLTAKQISQMLWYVIDGRSKGKQEAAIEDRNSFNEYHTIFNEVQSIFLQSKKTGRWWMQLPDKKFIACSYKDYLLASSNEIPERWLRAQERS